MMKAGEKLNNRRGSSVLLAMIYLLVCAAVATVLFVSSGNQSKRYRQTLQAEQRYYSVMSVAEMVKDSMENTQAVVNTETGEITLSAREKGTTLRAMISDDDIMISEKNIETYGGLPWWLKLLIAIWTGGRGLDPGTNVTTEAEDVVYNLSFPAQAGTNIGAVEGVEYIFNKEGSSHQVFEIIITLCNADGAGEGCGANQAHPNAVTMVFTPTLNDTVLFWTMTSISEGFYVE